MNGSPPISRMNGHTPSPPPPTSGTGGGGGRDGVTSGGGGTQPLPPACGARQLSKLKRFLTTLQQFGSDISPEIGDRVRTLVLGLVNNHLSIEEFHNKLQEATNFPLRPFVIPFLKANLPLLQRELLHCARLAKQSPQQYLAHNEHILFNASHSPTARDQITSPEINENGKRSSPDRCQENGFDRIPDGPPPAKRHQSHSPAGGPLNRLSPGGSYPTNTSSHYGSTPGSGGGGIHSGGQIRLDDIREIRERERIERERSERERAERDRERERHYYTGYPSRSDYTYDALDHQDDDWKHLETMLHCIVGMVDKAKRALVVLQERSQRDREEITYWVRRNEGDKKRTAAAGNNTNHYTRHQDDRLADVKRRAEEAVNAVKRQAVEELQKAVAAAEQNAADMVTAERAKMERMMGEIRRQARDEMASMIAAQEESSESCWNCGRKASETCSGCNTARYCGAFCQHKDWENHHRVCGANGTTNNNKPSLNNTADTSAGGASSRYDDHHHHQHHRRTTNVTDTHHSPSPPIAKTEAPTPPASNSTANPNATTPPAESGDGGVPIVVEPPVSPTPSHHSHYSTSSQPPNTNTHNTHSHTHHTPPNTADTSPTSRSRPSSPPPPHTSSSPSSSSTSPSTDVKPKVSSSHHHHHKSKSRSSSPHHDKREAKR